MKFTGTFRNLKKLGYEFMKLYASNYKVYNKKLKRSFKIWIWVANGGYIELDDLYNCSELFINAIKTINWDEIEEGYGGLKYTHVYFQHCEPEKGFEIKQFSFDYYYCRLIHERELEYKDKWSDKEMTEEEKTKLYEECYKEVRIKFDRCKAITEESAENLLREIEIIQNS